MPLSNLSFSAISEKFSKLVHRRKHRDPADPNPTGTTTGESFEPGDSDGGRDGTDVLSTANATGSRDPTQDEEFLRETMSHAGSDFQSVDLSPPGAGPGALREQFEKSFATCKTPELRFGLIYAYWYFSSGEYPTSLIRRTHPLWVQVAEVEAIISKGNKSPDMLKYATIVADEFYTIKRDRAWEAAPMGTNK